MYPFLKVHNANSNPNILSLFVHKYQVSIGGSGRISEEAFLAGSLGLIELSSLAGKPSGVGLATGCNHSYYSVIWQGILRMVLPVRNGSHACG
jgi:hypothetical protein